MRNIMLLSSLFLLACAHEASQPPKEYHWISLSEKGFTDNTIKVLKEDKSFQSDRGFENLETHKTALTDKKVDDIKKIVFIGDTGCRLKESMHGDNYQNCKDSKEWAYASVIEKIAAEKPDLIVHVGDYHYRENCSPGKVCRNYTDTIGYGWRSWEEDFFIPSEKGFAAAPWIFVRGNHEDCKRAWEGYKLLTEQTWKDTCVPNEKTEYISIGDLLLVDLDTASINDRPETPEAEIFWEQQFKDIEKEIANTKAKQVWLITHKPVTGLVDGGHGHLETTNVNLQKAFAKSGLQSKIQFMIAGHVHDTQLLQADGFPQQIVVGNSGTTLENNAGMMNREKILKNKIDGLTIKDFFSDTKSGHSFGYATMTRRSDDIGWELAFKDLEGQTTFTSMKTALPTLKIDKKKKKK
jgi:calcineurin-like phosphoesterase family protein